MSDFRCYLFGPSGHIVASAELTADSDQAAIEAARSVYAAATDRNGFELWEGARFVFSEGLTKV